jgi:hypothetical protein
LTAACFGAALDGAPASVLAAVLAAVGGLWVGIGVGRHCLVVCLFWVGFVGFVGLWDGLGEEKGKEERGGVL